MQRTEDEPILRGLLSSAGGGDRAAFHELFQRTSEAVHRLAWILLRERHAAEDVVVETFERVWRAASEWTAERGSARGWILTIARRVALDRLRSEGVRGGAQGDDALAELACARAGPLEESEAREGHGRLSAAIGRLASEERRCLEAAFVAGLTHREIAEAFDQPLGTVKTRIRRALGALRAQLSEPPHQKSHR